MGAQASFLSLLAIFSALVVGWARASTVLPSPPERSKRVLSWERVDVPASMAVGGSTAMAATTYRSSAIWLDPGRVVLTPPNETPIPMPPAPYVLRGLRIEVVDPTGSPVPLTEVYNHHIAFYDGVRSADLCGGAALQGRDAIWSVGAESRHTITFLPDGYGMHYPANASQWSANIHIIRTEGVAHVKHCIECHCQEPVAESGGGSEDCCPDGSLCGGVADLSSGDPASRPAVAKQKPYHVQYTVWHDKPAEEAARRHQEVRYHTLDASGCQLEWQVPALCAWKFRHAGSKAGSGQLPGVSGLRGSGRFFPFDFAMESVADMPAHCVSAMRWSTPWPYDGRVVFGKAHLHIGAIDIALYRERAGGSRRELICLNEARYGTGWRGAVATNGTTAASPSRELWDQPPGNELGYVVEVTSCEGLLDGDPVMLRRGDVLTVEARYRAGPWFEGVMGLLDIAVVPLSDEQGGSSVDSFDNDVDDGLAQADAVSSSQLRLRRNGGNYRHEESR